jgi:acyl-CoA synthetase (AMP-forming)/AMP-acid ligase II
MLEQTIVPAVRACSSVSPTDATAASVMEVAHCFQLVLVLSGRPGECQKHDLCRVHSCSHRKLRLMAYRIAVALRAHGQAEGCRVAIIGDMTLQAIACYLAVVLVGGAVVSVAPSFSAEEIAARLVLAKTTLIITQVRLALHQSFLNAVVVQLSAEICTSITGDLFWL